MERQIYLINKSPNNIEICVQELKKWFTFEPGRPLPLPLNIALKYKSSYGALEICNDPSKYYSAENPMKQLIIRDAGIGDLLLLEPCIRSLKEKTSREIDVLTRFPDVYKNYPYINNVIEMQAKDNLMAANISSYDNVEDLRSYSETSPNRHKQHRTLIYNERLASDLEDKEPRLYFGKKEKSILQRKDKYIYIGLQMDASHTYRRIVNYQGILDSLTSRNNVKVVLLGEKEFVKYRRNKNIIDYQGKTSIREAINIVRDLDYMIAADSGLMHVALSLHVPTACIFTIITPDFRLRYYTGQYRVIQKAGCDCLGCGDFHMLECKHGDIKKNPDFIPPCMDIDADYIVDQLFEMQPEEEKRVFTGDEKAAIKKVNINKLPAKKLTMPIIVQNEEHNLPRFIENVINHPCIGRVIAIDGGSNDKTVKLLESAGCDVHIHPYIKTYHEQQAMQRNISCSYVKDGENIIIMDIDECFSKELAEYLPVLAEASFTYGLISRRTFKLYKDINDRTKQIKDYPDWQPRFYKWDRKFKFVGGAHHITLNCPAPVRIQKDIIHFEEEGKDRKGLEKQWAGMMKDVKKLMV